MSLAPSSSAPTSSANATEASLNARLDADIDVLLKSLTQIIASGTLRQPVPVGDAGGEMEAKDRYRIAQERQAMEGAAANIVTATQSLLTLTTELKQALQLADLHMLNSTMRARLAVVRETRRVNKAELGRFAEELGGLVGEIEHALAGV
ncbi:uncharacterized protein EV422DRAFT_564277 [Fimicolochytrium jonesii]|uniref:uncharacterized protein n=1 Tax=Fimicolochytrium jonesii TaxID=1396493 RepID=UPI0022FEF79D|nr:uncharacterized protein EV422DRAFT_564277 [Fimicolochytrium jonesii]KAI8824918.1 hypothetical protein EV422DRAFT_564277 [Fimicolochytrium jonesii]